MLFNTKEEERQEKVEVDHSAFFQKLSKTNRQGKPMWPERNLSKLKREDRGKGSYSPHFTTVLTTIFSWWGRCSNRNAFLSYSLWNKIRFLNWRNTTAECLIFECCLRLIWIEDNHKTNTERLTSSSPKGLFFQVPQGFGLFFILPSGKSYGSLQIVLFC